MGKHEESKTYAPKLPVTKKRRIGLVPFFIPLLRSKYLQIELLRYLFSHKHEVCLFLRRLSTTSLEFYKRFQDELMMLFAEYSIDVKPPLKLDNTISGYDAAQSVTAFLDRRVKNLHKLLKHSDFKGMFTLRLQVRVEKFDLERD